MQGSTSDKWCLDIMLSKMKGMSSEQSTRKVNKLQDDQKNERKEGVIERKDKKRRGEEGQIRNGLPWLNGAVRFNLVWAGRIAKEQ